MALVALAGWLAGVGGCTKPNPNYLGDFDGGAADSRPSPDGLRRDGLRPPDGPRRDGPRPDLVAPPDVGHDGPTTCTKNGDCNDGVPCTDDRCDKGQCRYELKVGFCAIDGVCYKTGDVDPNNSCQSCDRARDPHAWTVAADAAPCASDGLSCTKDVCTAGKCTHELGTGCAIGGACVTEGTLDPQNACQACLGKVARDVYTPVDGEPCGADSLGLCLEGACRVPTRQPAPPAGANIERPSLVAVDQQVGTQEVWAGGNYALQTGPMQQPRGMLLCLSGASKGKLQYVDQPVRGLSERLAVSGQGQYYYEVGQGWQPQPALAQALSYVERQGVWGRPLSAQQEVYYLAGAHAAGAPGIARCLWSAGTWSCTPHTGFDGSALVTGVFGTLASGGQGPVWALTFSDYEHIYAHDGTGTQWSRQPPAGCTDAFGGACYTSFSTDYRDISGSGAQDVWAVGLAGMIMHYDGTKWQRHGGVMQYQANYNYDAVYSDAATGLVLFAAHRDLSFGRYVSLYTYNRKLDRWRGPVTVDKRFDNPQSNAQINDIGGPGVGDLWLVGHRPGPQVGSQEAWALTFK